jgi:hypothetical protein
MDEGAASMGPGKGPDLLLTHCTALTAFDDARPPAYRRLEQALGKNLARLLLVALATRRSRRTSLAA